MRAGRASTRRRLPLPRAEHEGRCDVSVKLSQRSFDYAKELIANRRGVLDDRADWSDHKPSGTAQKRMFEEEHAPNMDNGTLAKTTSSDRSRIKFPYGDFKDVRH
jgi:hypothetical protein